MIWQLLEKLGLKYEDLNSAERDTFQRISEKYSIKELKVEDLKEYIGQMVDALTKELVGYETPKSFVEMVTWRKRKVHLEARLKNALMFQDFLTSPDRAKKMVEQMLENLKKK